MSITPPPPSPPTRPASKLPSYSVQLLYYLGPDEEPLALWDIVQDRVDVTEYDSLESLPMFDGDMNVEHVGAQDDMNVEDGPAVSVGHAHSRFEFVATPRSPKA